MVFLSIKKMLDCTHFARQRLFTTETKTIFLPSSSFKFIFYMLQCFNNSTVLQVAKKPIETVLILQYFKRVWYRERNKTTVLQKRETYLVLLTFLLWFKLFPISFALSWQPLSRWGQTTPSMCAKRVGSFFQNGAEKVYKGFWVPPYWIYLPKRPSVSRYYGKLVRAIQLWRSPWESWIR